MILSLIVQLLIAGNVVLLCSLAAIYILSH